MDPLTLLAIAAVVTLYAVITLCAVWAWRERVWLLAVPLTIIFVTATVAWLWVVQVT